MDTPRPSSTESSVLQIRRHHIDPERYALYRRVMLIAIIGNGFLALAKGAVALLSNSNAVLADAANSLADSLYSVFMVAGLWLSQQPADHSHPQGHSRFEPVVSIVIAMTMGLAGYEVIRRSFSALGGDLQPIAMDWPVVVLVGSGLIKAVMFFFVHQVAQRMHSPAIEAAAQDNLADVLTSIAALVGVVGSNFVTPIADPLAGILVSLWIFRTAYSVLRENLGYLTGEAASSETVALIVERARGVDGVDDVHQVVADYVGPRLRVDMHINVDGNLPLTRIHEITEAVSLQVEEMDEVDLVFIHVEPTR